MPLSSRQARWPGTITVSHPGFHVASGSTAHLTRIDPVLVSWYHNSQPSWISCGLRKYCSPHPVLILSWWAGTITVSHPGFHVASGSTAHLTPYWSCPRVHRLPFQQTILQERHAKVSGRTVTPPPNMFTPNTIPDATLPINLGLGPASVYN